MQLKIAASFASACCEVVSRSPEACKDRRSCLFVHDARIARCDRAIYETRRGRNRVSPTLPSVALLLDAHIGAPTSPPILILYFLSSCLRRSFGTYVPDTAFASFLRSWALHECNQRTRWKPLSCGLTAHGLFYIKKARSKQIKTFVNK